MKIKMPLHLLVAVGSRHDQTCSIGSFARTEALALESFFDQVSLIEPTPDGEYLKSLSSSHKPDVILFHAPSLHDRKKPWNALVSAARLRLKFPKSLFLAVVHEYSEAPWHWRLRQAWISKIAHGVIVNSLADERHLSRLHSCVCRTHLGPTLFFGELLAQDSRAALAGRLEHQWKEARRLSAPILETAITPEALLFDEKWILHPGLFTPGKGLHLLTRLAPLLPKNSRLIVMGSAGPKQKDMRFARNAFQSLRATFGSKLTILDSPSDETFKQLLLAADLVVLPYDHGLSERRSSFLSAMCCGANIFTTLSELSRPLKLESTGIHHSTERDWASGSESIARTIEGALSENKEKTMERRLLNLEWGKQRGWSTRAGDILTLINKLTAKDEPHEDNRK